MSTSKSKSGKVATVEAVANMERTEMQSQIRAALDAKVKDLNLAPTVEHARRMIRTLLREAAKIALSGGCPPQAFAGMAYESLVKEAHEADDGKVVDALFTFVHKHEAQA